MRYTELQLGSAAFDQQPNDGSPRRKLLILAPPRSGSYMLCRLMVNAGLGVPHEYFNQIHIAVMGERWGVPNARNGERLREPAVMLRYLHALFAHRTQRGLFAAKLQYKQYELFLRGPVGDLLLDGAMLVYLTRRDTVAQAVSRHFAEVTGRWSFERTRLTRPRQAEQLFDVAAIAHILAEIHAEEILWERLFVRLAATPLRLSYEGLCDDHPGALRAVAGACGVAMAGLDLGYHDDGRYDSDASNPSKEAVADFFRKNYVPGTVARPRRTAQPDPRPLPATVRGGVDGDISRPGS